MRGYLGPAEWYCGRKIIRLAWVSPRRWIEFAAWVTSRSALKGWSWEWTGRGHGHGFRAVTPGFGFAAGWWRL